MNSTVDDLSMTGPQYAEDKVRLNSEIQTNTNIFNKVRILSNKLVRNLICFQMDSKPETRGLSEDYKLVFV